MNAAAPLRAALELRAAATPEDPFLFFRGERGHFRWWSFARCAACLAGESGARATSAGEGEAESFLERLALEGEPPLVAPLAGLLGPSPTRRDIWISHRSVEVPAQSALALYCARSGAAVLREPGERLHPELLAWARPTLLCDEAGELERLIQGFAALAPGLAPARWRRRRLARLRAVLVQGEGSGGLAARLAALGVGPGARVLPFPGSGW